MADLQRTSDSASRALPVTTPSHRQTRSGACQASLVDRHAWAPLSPRLRFARRAARRIRPPCKLPVGVKVGGSVAGEPHGYFDGWREDGCFHYTGEGQYGDQQMKSGNASILNHE